MYQPILTCFVHAPLPPTRVACCGDVAAATQDVLLRTRRFATRCTRRAHAAVRSGGAVLDVAGRLLECCGAVARAVKAITGSTLLCVRGGVVRSSDPALVVLEHECCLDHA